MHMNQGSPQVYNVKYVLDFTSLVLMILLHTYVIV